MQGSLFDHATTADVELLNHIGLRPGTSKDSTPVASSIPAGSSVPVTEEHLEATNPTLSTPPQSKQQLQGTKGEDGVTMVHRSPLPNLSICQLVCSNKAWAR
jgi:hypothetical protein